MSFFNKFNETDKFNLFLGDFLVKKIGYPTRMELAKLLMKDMKENIKGYIRDDNSLFQVSQVYLDGVVSSRSSLLKKIKNLYEASKEINEITNIFSNDEKINAIFSTNYDLVLDEINSNKLLKVLATDSSFPQKQEDKIRHYKILGDIAKYDKICVSIQDFRKLKVLEFYKNYFKEIKNEINNNPTFILGLDLNDLDFIDMLEFLLEGTNKKENLFAICNSNVLKTKTIERLNNLGIKLLPHSEDEFFNELKMFLEKNVENEEDLLEKKIYR